MAIKGIRENNSVNKFTKEPLKTKNDSKGPSIFESYGKYDGDISDTQYTASQTKHSTKETLSYYKNRDNLSPVFGLQEEHDINKKDSRYNLTDVSQLDELVYKYQNNRSKLSETEQIHYDNLISNYKDLISQIPSNDICTNLEVRKIFLALKKLDKYDYDSSKFPGLSVGSLDETSKILGVYSEDFSNLESLLSQDELYAEAMRNFYDFIYQSSNFCVLLNDDKNKVAELASNMLDEECAMYGEDKSKIVKIQDHFERSATYISDCDNEWNNWELQVVIYDKGIDSEGEYLPLDLVALHELYHVKQFAPGIAENSPSDFCEIGASIDTLVRSDEIHKKINGIDISDVVEYPVTLNNSVNLGTLANEFRSIKEKYHFENYEQVLITPEGRNLVIQYFK